MYFATPLIKIQLSRISAFQSKFHYEMKKRDASFLEKHSTKTFISDKGICAFYNVILVCLAVYRCFAACVDKRRLKLQFVQGIGRIMFKELKGYDSLEHHYAMVEVNMWGLMKN